MSAAQNADYERVKEALLWLVRYRETTVIPPDDVAETLRWAKGQIEAPDEDEVVRRAPRPLPVDEDGNEVADTVGVPRAQLELILWSLEGFLKLFTEDWRADAPVAKQPWEGNATEVWNAVGQARVLCEIIERKLAHNNDGSEEGMRMADQSVPAADTVVPHYPWHKVHPKSISKGSGHWPWSPQGGIGWCLDCQRTVSVEERTDGQ